MENNILALGIVVPTRKGKEGIYYFWSSLQRSWEENTRKHACFHCVLYSLMDELKVMLHCKFGASLTTINITYYYSFILSVLSQILLGCWNKLSIGPLFFCLLTSILTNYYIRRSSVQNILECSFSI